MEGLKYLKTLVELVRAMQAGEVPTESLRPFVADVLKALRVHAQTLKRETDAGRREQSLLAGVTSLGNIAPLITLLPDNWLVALNQEELMLAIKDVDSALQSCESVLAESAVPPGGKRGWRRRNKDARKCAELARLHATLARAYLRVGTGDFSQNVETSVRHFQSGIRALELGNLGMLAIHVCAEFGNAMLTLPTEHREHYTPETIDTFYRAKEDLAPYRVAIQALRDGVDQRKTLLQVLWVSFRSVVPKLLKTVPWGLRRNVLDDLWGELLTPEFAARLDLGLGLAYRYQGKTDKAVEHFDLALEVLPAKFSELKPVVFVEKGLAYLEAKSGDRGKNVVLAAESFGKAWAECVQNGVVRNEAQKTYALALVGDARAYLALEALGRVTPEDRKKLLPMVINELRIAARIARAYATHQVVQEALLLLGKGYELQGDLPRAYRAAVLASRVADRLLRRARTFRLSSYWIGNAAPLYELLIRMSLEYLRLSRSRPGGINLHKILFHSVLSYFERGKTVFLQRELVSRGLLPKGATPPDIEDFLTLRRQLHATELRLLEEEGALGHLVQQKDLAALRGRLTVLESHYVQELEKVRERFCDPHYDPDQPLAAARFTEIDPIVKELSKEAETALVEYYITGRYLVVFVLLPTKLSFAHAGISRDELDDLEGRWLKGCAELRPSHPKHWESGYLLQVLDRLKRAAEIPAGIIEKWQRETHRRIQRIIIVPHRFLHLIPLHAIQLPHGDMWDDAVAIQYAPSASVLLRLLDSETPQEGLSDDRSPGERDNRVLSISYSAPSDGEPLLFNLHEAQAVAEVTGGRLLAGREATPARVKKEMQEATYIHFACHGMFDIEAPLAGGLKLAPEEIFQEAPCEGGSGDNAAAKLGARECGRLTLGEIFRTVRLPKTPLVVLSACETGVVKAEKQHDEYIGLPGGFLYAGAKTVIGSLWRVPDVATWFLMRAFAQEVAAGIGPLAALRRAQQVLWGLSAEHVMQQITIAAGKEYDSCRREEMIEVARRVCRQGEVPFASPYWWAGFTVNGL